MKYFISVVVSILLLSCSTHNKDLIEQRKNWDYKNWKQNFKDRAFCKCIVSGFDSNIKEKIIYEDKSFYNAIAITFFDSIIDINIKNEILKMKSDSINSLTKVSEAGAGKMVFNHCLKYYKSAKLDSIVKFESKKWKKIKQIDSLVFIKVPSY